MSNSTRSGATRRCTSRSLASLALLAGVLSIPATALTASAGGGPTLADLATSLQRNDFERAASEAQILADQGSARARQLLGRLHQHGLGVPRSWEQAASHFHAASEQGLGDASFELAQLLEAARLRPEAAADAFTISERYAAPDAWIWQALDQGSFRAFEHQCQSGIVSQRSPETRIEGMAWCDLANNLMPSLGASKSARIQTFHRLIQREADAAEHQAAERTATELRMQYIEADRVPIAALSPGTPLTRASSVIPLIPLEVGNRWRYLRSGAEEGSREARITSQQRVGDEAWYAFDRGLGAAGGEWVVKRKLGYYEAWAPDPTVADDETTSPYLRFLDPAPRGYSYPTEQWTTLVQGEAEEISVPAGRFECIRYTLEAPGEFVERLCIAPGVGLVHREIEAVGDPSSRITEVLESYQVGASTALAH